MPRIESDSLAEHLYNHHGLADIERLSEDKSFESLKRQWELSDEQCKQQIKLAIHYIKRD